MSLLFNSAAVTRILLVAFTVFSASLVAQTKPEAGSLLRDIESTIPDLDKQPKLVVELPPLLADTGVTVLVTAIEVSGYEGMATEQEISDITALYIGKELGFNSLKRIADLITAQLKTKGFFLAYAYLPKQELDQGVLKIVVLPGRLDGAIQINLQRDDGSEVNLSKQQVAAVLTNKISGSEGSLLHAQKIEEAVLTLNDFAGIAASMNLEKGTVLGSTKVQLNVFETPRYAGLAWVDNYGSYYTGKNRANVLANINNVTGRGDLLGTIVSLSENQSYARLNYLTPLHASGLTLNLAVTRLDYTLGEALKATDSSGESTVYSLRASYPMMRSRLENIYLDTSVDYKQMTDSNAGETVRDRKFTNVNVAMRGDVVDGFLRGGYTGYTLGVTFGDLDRSGVASDLSFDQQTFNTHGRFAKLNTELYRLQRFSPQWTLFSSFKGQIAFDNLDSAENFSMAGPAGIRSYASGESAGDQGWFATVEARYDVPKFNMNGATLQLQAFVDTGRVTLSKEGYDTYIPSNNEETNQYALTGAGVGAILRKSREYELSAMYAHQLDANVDQRTTTGLDSEGGTDEYRFWLQAKVWF